MTYGGLDLIPLNYTRSDFMSNMNSRKSTSWYVYTLGDAAISRRSIKQQYIIDLTTEVESIAATKAIKEAIWIKKFLLELCITGSVTHYYFLR